MSVIIVIGFPSTFIHKIINENEHKIDVNINYQIFSSEVFFVIKVVKIFNKHSRYN